MDSTEDAFAAVRALIASYGAHARPLREVVAALTERSRPLAALVRDTATPRRTVEEVLAALGAALEETPGGVSVRPELRETCRDRIGYDQLRRTAVPDPLVARLADRPELTTQLAALIAAAPAASRALDHVAATAATAAWRGLWLDARYDLGGARLLCVGDHDLTSLAVGLVNPHAAVTVVDLDERILAYIDAQAVRLGLDVRCLAADLRLSLPPGAEAGADVVFTDPPYTPEGVRLFLARGAAGLKDRERGRLVMAYGFSDRTPALGLKVQQAAQELGLAFEAILPRVQRYDGAQAIGSASDLYVCRPTPRTWKVLEGASEVAANIYTHGPQSLEAGSAIDPAALDAVLAALAQPATVRVGHAWPGGAGPVRLRLDRLVAAGLPPAATVRGVTMAAVDLSGDPGPLLLRALLAGNADRVAVLVGNDHAAVASEAGQRGLAELIGAKYALRFLRNTPGPAHAIVVADAVPTQGLEPAEALVRRLLDRAHGKVGNVWRDALVAALGLTKNAGRAAVRAAASRPDVLDRALIELPEHLLAALLADVARSASPA